MREYSCTAAEREFLDAMLEGGGNRDAVPLWPRFRDPADCPVCGYDGLGPKSERLEKALIELLDEHHGRGHDT